MSNQSPFGERYKKAMEPISARMDHAKWDVTRAVTLGGAGLSTAIVFLITQIGIKSCAIYISLFCASVAIPTWLALWRVGEAYSFFGPRSYGHFSTPRGSGIGLLLFAVGGILLLTSFVSLIWHFSVVSAAAFLVGSLCMIVFVFKHQASVQSWVERDPGNDA
jgi:hypothetical protein